MRHFYIILTLAAYILAGNTATINAQNAPLIFKLSDGKWVQADSADIANADNIPLDPNMMVWPTSDLPAEDYLNMLNDSTVNEDLLLEDYFLRPAIFGDYKTAVPEKSGLFGCEGNCLDGATGWVNSRLTAARRINAIKQRYMIEHPDQVRYNINWLPEAPKRYYGVIDPNAEARIVIVEEPIDKGEVHKEIAVTEVKHKNWIHNFNSAIQFSQAYISPNWYQGGNNNLNFILNLGWDVKLNSNFHPNLLFENSVSYKLALNSAPEDSLRNYSISEDLFQVNTRFGIKALSHWYYSATLQFKTQFFSNYKSNTNDLTATFLSPAELNIGVGMTYNYESPSKKLNISASISPLSYNFKACINERVDPTTFGIKLGHKTVNQIGSGVDATLTWNIAHNIKLLSHLTGFTNYSYIQADWENTFSFTINKFLSTQIYVHLRYDTQTPRLLDSRWSKLQMKEILSFGFAYSFGTV